MFFDDLPGNIERAAASAADAVAVVVEWADLDPRLGLRRLGGWRADQLDEIVAGAGAALARLEGAIAVAAGARRVVWVAPTLALPPLFPQARGRADFHDTLRRLAADTAARLASQPGVSVASLQRLDELSPPHTRRDVRDELATGFPYSLHHASAVAALLAELLPAPVRRKGLITDLDDTLWAGILDEQGPEGVSWTGRDHRHGLYQQQLTSLAGAGVLLGVASRNDPGLAADALARPDLIISTDALYPVEASWGLKSDSIRRILEVWNIAADAVVFVDDDPLARDEAAAALPGLLTLSPPQDEDGVWAFLVALRSVFGKGEVSAEDALRLDSIRSAQALRPAEASEDAGGDFLAQIGGTVEFRTGAARAPRVLEPHQQDQPVQPERAATDRGRSGPSRAAGHRTGHGQRTYTLWPAGRHRRAPRLSGRPRPPRRHVGDELPGLRPADRASHSQLSLRSPRGVRGPRSPLRPPRATRPVRRLPGQMLDGRAIRGTRCACRAGRARRSMRHHCVHRAGRRRSHERDR